MQPTLPFSNTDLDKVINVAQVKHRSPFRYPGGKTWLVPRIRKWLLSKDSVSEFVEPFCGGAIVGLSVAFDNLAERVTLIEIDPQVAAVWQVILKGSANDVRWLVERIINFTMNRENVEETLAQCAATTREQAFATILKNRVNHGGCLAQGAGLLKNGENGKGVGSRWYADTIARRIQDIQPIRDRVNFLCEDGISYLDNVRNDSDAVFFIDPPYWVAGTRLYDHSELNHQYLFDVVNNLCGDFLMTYDNAPEIRGYAESHKFDMKMISMQNKNHQEQRELLIGRSLSWLDN